MESAPTNNTQIELERLEKVQGSLESASKEIKEEIDRLRVVAYQDAITNLMVQTKHFKWELTCATHNGTLVLRLLLPDVYIKTIQPLIYSIPSMLPPRGECLVSYSWDSGVKVSVLPPSPQGQPRLSALFDLIEKCELEHVSLGSGAAAEAEQRYKEAAKHVEFYEDFSSTIRRSLRGEHAFADKGKLPNFSFGHVFQVC